MRRCFSAAFILGFLPLSAYAGSLGLDQQLFSHVAAQGVTIGSDTVNVYHIGGAFTQITFSASANAGWLSVTSDSPVCDEWVPSAAELRYATESLSAGTYTGKVTFTSTSCVPPTATATSIVTILPQSKVIGVSPEIFRISLPAYTTNTMTVFMDVWNAGTPAIVQEMQYYLAGGDWIQLPVTDGTSTGEHDRLSVVLNQLDTFAVGSYTGAVTISTPGYDVSNSPRSVSVILNVYSAEEMITISTNRYRFTVTQGTNPSDEQLEIMNMIGGEVAYSVQTLVPWIDVQPTSGVCYTVEYLTNRFFTSTMEPGRHTGSYFLHLSGTTNSPRTIGVIVTVEPYDWVIAMSGTYTTRVSAGSGTVTQRVDIWNAGTGVISYAVSAVPESGSWLSVTPSMGSSTNGSRTAHYVTMDPSGVAEGSHTGTLTVTAVGAINSPCIQQVVMQVASRLAANPAIVTNSVMAGGTAAARTLGIWNAGSVNTVDFTLEKYGDWFSLSDTSGSSWGQTNLFTITYDSTNLPVGVHNGWIRVLGLNQTLHVPVRLSVGNSYTRFEERIVFAANLDGDMDIWSIKPDGSGLRQILNKAGIQTSPKLSPDGTQVVYEEIDGDESVFHVLDLGSGSDEELDGFSGPVWMADSSGWYDPAWNRQDQTASAAAFRPCVTLVYERSPNGSKTPVFNSWNHGELAGVDPISGSIYCAFEPCDGGVPALKKYNPATKAMSSLLPADGISRYGLAVSPNGSQVSFHARPAGMTNTALYLLESGGSTGTRLSTNNSVAYSSACFSPDGSKVAGVFSSASQKGLCVFNNGVETRILSGTNLVAAPSWGVAVHSDPALAVSTNLLHASVERGSSNGVERTFEIWNRGDGFLQFSATSSVPWMAVEISSGISTGEHQTATLNSWSAGLGEGVYTGRVTIISNGTNGNAAVSMVLTVLPSHSILTFDPPLIIEAVTNELPFSQLFTIRNAGGGSMGYTVTVDSAWMSVVNPTGFSTGQDAHVELQFNTAGLAPGSYSGFIGIHAGGIVTSNLVTFNVGAGIPGAPEIGLSVTNLTSSTPRLKNAASQTFSVSNAGGGTLYFYLTDTENWIETKPYSSTGILLRSTGGSIPITVVYNTSNLLEDVHNGRIGVIGAGTTNYIDVAMTVQDPLMYTLTLLPAAGGTASLIPSESSYEHGTHVQCIADPDDYHTFYRWWGIDGLISPSHGYVIVNSDRIIWPEFKSKTFMGGYITNAVTGQRLEGVQVKTPFGDYASTSNGAYLISATATQFLYDVSCEGYLSLKGQPACLGRYQYNEINIGLMPNPIANVSAQMKPNQYYVLVYYDLLGPAGQTLDVSLEYSLGGSSNWVPITNATGDAGADIPVGTGHFAVWNARRALGYLDSMTRIRVTAGGYSVESEPFYLNTAYADNVRFRTYNDKNSNGLYDPGEEMAGAEFYYDGRTEEFLVGETGDDGIITVPQARRGAIFFARKHIHDRGTVKDGHAVVGNIMRTLWADSDLGGTNDTDAAWDGMWDSCKINSSVWNTLEQGKVVDVPLLHSLWEWSLTVDVPGETEERPDLVADYVLSMEKASRYLYWISHGHIKLGAVHLEGKNQNIIDNADVEVLRGVGRANAYVGAIYTEPDWTCQYDINVYEYRQKKNMYNRVGSDNWARTLVHEFGHYAMSFYDEYVTDGLEEDAWAKYRRDHTNEFPSNFGFMDNQQAIYQMSSRNDYPPDYWEYDDDYRTEQIYENDVPCWPDWERTFEADIAGYLTRIISQTPGQRINGKSTSEDRFGTYHVPQPYTVVQVQFQDWGWADIYDTSSRKSKTASGTPGIIVQAVCDGRPAANARIAVRGDGSEPFYVAGETDANGELPITFLREGAAVDAYWQGLKLSKIFEGRKGILTFDFTGEAETLRRASEPLSPNRLGMVVSGDWNGSNYNVRMAFSHPLSNAPAVIAYQQLNKTWSTNVLSVTTQSPTNYTAVLELTNGWWGELEISCGATNGQTLVTLDSYQTFVLSPSNSISDFPVRPSRGARELNTFAMLYQGYAPVIVPSGHPYPTNQIGPALGLFISGNPILDTNFFRGTFRFDEDDIAGADITSARVLCWNPWNQSWSLAESETNVMGLSVGVLITNAGVYALVMNGSSDVTPPSAITDLRAEPGVNPWTVRFNWTAPGGDANSGQAYAYDLRYATNAINTTGEWDAAVSLPFYSKPQAAGTAESTEVEMPESGAAYCFAIRARDEAGNWSALTNPAYARSAIIDEDGDGIPDQIAADFNMRDRMGPMDDADGDGLTTWDEYVHNTDASSPDTDGDGMDDGYEANHGLNPRSALDADDDPDGDTLTNKEEHDLFTDPNNADTDGDGIPDDWEAEKNLDPLTDGREDGADQDPDNDTFINIDEYTADTDPTNNLSYISLDDMDQGAAGRDIMFWGSARRIYDLLYATNLVPGAWQSLQGEFYGDGGTNSTIVTDPGAAPWRIYRLRVRTP